MADHISKTITKWSHCKISSSEQHWLWCRTCRTSATVSVMACSHDLTVGLTCQLKSVKKWGNLNTNLTGNHHCYNCCCYHRQNRRILSILYLSSSWSSSLLLLLLLSSSSLLLLLFFIIIFHLSVNQFIYLSVHSFFFLLYAQCDPWPTHKEEAVASYR